MPPESVQIVALGPSDARLWHVVADPATSVSLSEQQLLAQVSWPESLRHYRLVAIVATRVVAKFAADVSGMGHLTFFMPGFADGLDETTRLACAGGFLTACLEILKLRPELRFAETQLFDTLPDTTWWQTLLARSGFQETARAHLYFHDLAPERIQASAAERLLFLPIPQVERAVVEDLFSLVSADTLDQAERCNPIPSAERLAFLPESAFLAYDPNLWEIAYRDGQPIAFLFVSAQNPVPGEEMPDFLVEMGVTPVARGGGIGRTLIRRALHAAVARGSTGMLARIDDANLPSIRIHRQEGFQSTHGTYRTFRWLRSGTKGKSPTSYNI